MKIQGKKNIPSAPVVVMGQSAPSEEESVAGAAEVSGDSLEISSASREVGDLKKALAGVPEVRLEMIEGIRGRVDEGSYYVESEKLARSVVNEALRDAVRRHRRAAAFSG